MKRIVPAVVSVVAVAIAAGCGGSASTSGSASGTGSVLGTTATVGTTTAMTTTVGTTTSAAQSSACTTLRVMTQQAMRNVQTSVSGLAGVRSLGMFKQRMNALQHQLKQSATRIESTSTPAGPLTRDKRQIASALDGIAARIASARQAAASGNVAGAAGKLTSMPQLKKLRSADADLARRCANT